MREALALAARAAGVGEVPVGALVVKDGAVIGRAVTAVANGDLSKKITVDVKGEILELKNTINTMVDQLSSFAAEVDRKSVV